MDHKELYAQVMAVLVDGGVSLCTVFSFQIAGPRMRKQCINCCFLQLSLLERVIE